MSWWRLCRKEPKLLCDCSESKSEKESHYQVPLVGGYHTMFYAGKCKKCGGWCGFPSYNFLLAIREGTEETIKLLEDNGVPVNAIRDFGRVEI